MFIIDKIKDAKIRVWYMEQTVKNGWSYYMFGLQLKSNLFLSQTIDNKLNNFR